LKYIICIFVVIISFSLLALYLNKSSHLPEKDVVLTINKRQITRDEFDKRFAKLYQGDKQGFINSLITKELMIQEAQKEGIDQAETFRYLIQEYYEQSLVRQIMDKKIRSMKATVGNDEIDRCLAFQNSTVHLTIFKAANEESARNRIFKGQEVRIVAARDLSSEISEQLETLKTGELTDPLCSDSGCDLLRIDKIESPPAPAYPEAVRDKLRTLLQERKKQRAMDAWIAGMKAKSTIAVMVK
jgi:hypothetical protein